MRASGSHDLSLLAAGAAGGLLPDVDIPGSKAWRRLIPLAAAALALPYLAAIQPPPPLSLVAWTTIAFTVSGLLSHHRGATHSILAVAVTALAAITSRAGLHGAALTLGLATHILLDTVTPEGTSLLWPSKRRLSVPAVRTGSPADLVTGLLATAAAVVLAAK